MPKKVILDPIKIDEMNLDAMDLDALNHFLKEKQIENMWLMNQEYSYTYQNIQYIFCFTKTLLKRQRNRGKEGERFEVFNIDDNPLGEGGYATVYPILGTIKFNACKPVIKTDKHRIVKIEQHNEVDRTHLVEQEYKNLVHVGHLGVKPPVFIDKNEKSAKISLLVMKQAEGFTLEKILHPIKRRSIEHLIPKLTVAKRIEITLAILKAVKEQVLEKGMVHRDLKPGNMIIDLSKSPPKVTIIDYGNAIMGDLTEYRRVGTTAYRAPELYLGVPTYTAKSDAYAVGRILSYLWGDDYQNYYMPHNTPWNGIKEKSSNSDLFSDSRVILFKKDKEQIRHCLNGLLNENAPERLTLDEATQCFLKINPQKYQLKQIKRLSKTQMSKFEESLENQIKTLHILLVKLSAKGKSLEQRGFSAAGKKAHELSEQLKAYTETFANNPDPIMILMDYRKQCLQEINSSRELLQQHRGFRWLIAEITTAISLLGIGYLLVAGINYKITGRLGLFSQTKSDKLVDDIQNAIFQISA